MKRKAFLLGLCLLLCQSIRSAPFPLGNGFSYQGHLTEGSIPANGVFDFYFELFDAPLSGALLGALELEEVEVTRGLFVVELDFGPGKFNGEARWLQIGVQGTNGLTLLSPRQPLSPAPYAVFSPRAGGVTNGAITSAMLGTGVVTSDALANSAVTASALANGAVTTPKLADGSVTSAKLAAGTVVTNVLATTNNLALGTASQDGRLDVYRTGVGTPAIQLLGSLNLLRIFSDDALEKTRLDAGPGWGQLQLNNSSPVGQRAAILTANATGGGSLTLYNSNGQDRAVLFGGNGGGELDLRGSDGLEKVRLAAGSNLGALTLNNNFGFQGAVCAANFFNGGGLLALNSTNGQSRAVLDGGSAGGKMNLYNRSGGGTVLVTSDTGSGHSDLSLFNSAGTRTIQAQAGPGQISTFGSDGLEQIRLWGASWGEVLLFDNAGNDETVKLSSGGDSGGTLNLRNATGNDRIVIQGQDASGGGFMSVRDGSGTETIALIGAEASTQGGEIRVKKADGSITVRIDGDFNGEGRITTQVLQITGGSDLSEQFDIRRFHNELRPGMVVCIDSAHPGQLVASTRAYDRTVAGIISGAGGVKPGMLMGQTGSVADGKHPVALTGRVYALADASNEPIEPGDLLTTSDTPGHAMKVSHHSRAQGAVIGKAMSALGSGSGLVLVLVSLQ